MDDRALLDRFQIVLEFRPFRWEEEDEAQSEAVAFDPAYGGTLNLNRSLSRKMKQDDKL